MKSDKITVELTSEEYSMIQYCIEYISANERNFDEDGEKVLKSIADKFNSEYIEEANVNYKYEDKE